MGIFHLKDQWPIDDEMMMFDRVSVYGEGFVYIWAELMECGWKLSGSKELKKSGYLEFLCTRSTSSSPGGPVTLQTPK